MSDSGLVDLEELEMADEDETTYFGDSMISEINITTLDDVHSPDKP